MFRLLKYLNKKEWGLILAALALIVLQVALDLSLPDYMEEITHLVETEGSTMAEIRHAGRGMLFAALGSLLSAVLTVLFAARAAALFAATLREQLFNRIEQFSGTELDRFTTPSLINRTTGDVLQVQLAFVLGLEVLIKAPIKAIWAICKISAGDFHWSAITALGVVMFLLITVVLIAVSMPKFRKMQALADDLNRITRENISGIRDIRAGGGEHHEEERFEAANVKLTDTHLFTAHAMSFLSPAMQLVNNLLTLGCYWVGMLLINAAPAGERLGLFSDTVAFLSYMMQIFSAFLLFATVSTLLPRAIVSAKRILEVLNTPVSLTQGKVTKGLEQGGGLEFRHVSFRYAGAEHDAVSDLTFSAKKGQTVGLIGTTGCGKSTVVQLAVRLYDAGAGEVLVDGVNVKDYSRKTLYEKIALVDQAPFLFRGTVRQNIAFGHCGDEEIDEDKLQALMLDCDAPSFAEDLPAGFDTEVVEGGANLSEGQLHRIALARALCSDPEILILDDMFSAFDRHTGAQLRATLQERRGDMTVLIAAQRVATVRGADLIVVLEQGRVVGKGTHAELMESCALYRTLAIAQGEEGTK